MEEKDKKILLTVGVVAIVALVASNFGQITGGAITDPSSLSVFQEGKKLTVQVNYPAGKYGRPNNIIFMQVKEGTKSEDQTTGCDPERGLRSRGSADCSREIAVFDLTGDRWASGELVTFSVRGTDVTRDYRIP